MLVFNKNVPKHGMQPAGFASLCSAHQRLMPTLGGTWEQIASFMDKGSKMDRFDWLIEKRREAEERYDTLWAPLYGEKWGVYSNATHQRFIQKFLSLLPQQSTILDAACGAGRYMSMLLEQGYTVVGLDQSQGMLARAKAKFPTVQVEKVGLQLPCSCKVIFPMSRKVKASGG